MIKINDRFAIERDQHQWLLHEWRDGVPSKRYPNPGRQMTTTFYPKLQQVCWQILDRSAGDAHDVDSIIAAVATAKREILDSLTTKED